MCPRASVPADHSAPLPVEYMARSTTMGAGLAPIDSTVVAKRTLLSPNALAIGTVNLLFGAT